MIFSAPSDCSTSTLMAAALYSRDRNAIRRTICHVNGRTHHRARFRFAWELPRETDCSATAAILPPVPVNQPRPVSLFPSRPPLRIMHVIVPKFRFPRRAKRLPWVCFAACFMATALFAWSYIHPEKKRKLHMVCVVLCGRLTSDRSHQRISIDSLPRMFCSECQP